MTERTDNTSAMAIWGRLFLTLVLAAFWIGLQIVAGFCVIFGFGIAQSAFDITSPMIKSSIAGGIIGLGFNALFTMFIVEMCIAVWHGPKKEKT